MAIRSVPFHSQSSSVQLRPVQPRRDYAQVADLIELCFSKTLDADGRHYVQRMRAEANNSGFVDWSIQLYDEMPYGFVWIENNKIVGNLSLIPYTRSIFGFGKKIYLIANVAVHPDYRGRGIAKALTLKALRTIKERSDSLVWLHVRDDNPAAHHLYLSLGFREAYRRTTWQCYPSDLSSTIRPALPPENFQTEILPRHSTYWKDQKEWFYQTYPPSIEWYLPVNTDLLKPGIGANLRCIFLDMVIEQWCLQVNGKILGCMMWQSTHSFTDNIWLVVDPYKETLAIPLLLREVSKRYIHSRPITFEYPWRRSADLISQCGFSEHYTLIWMHG